MIRVIILRLCLWVVAWESILFQSLLCNLRASRNLISPFSRTIMSLLFLGFARICPCFFPVSGWVKGLEVPLPATAFQDLPSTSTRAVWVGAVRGSILRCYMLACLCWIVLNGANGGYVRHSLGATTEICGVFSSAVALYCCLFPHGFQAFCSGMCSIAFHASCWVGAISWPVAEVLFCRCWILYFAKEILQYRSCGTCGTVCSITGAGFCTLRRRTWSDTGTPLQLSCGPYLFPGEVRVVISTIDLGGNPWFSKSSIMSSIGIFGSPLMTVFFNFFWICGVCIEGFLLPS